MATTQTNELLTDEFLMDLYYTCFKNEYILSIVCEHIRPEHLPDREFQALHKALRVCSGHHANALRSVW